MSLNVVDAPQAPLAGKERPGGCLYYQNLLEGGAEKPGERLKAGADEQRKRACGQL
jgi:hypothetical protein